MEWETYVDEALKTASPQSQSGQLAQAFMGLVGEVEEVHQSTPGDDPRLQMEFIREVGDCLWYLALAWDAFSDNCDPQIPFAHDPSKVYGNGYRAVMTNLAITCDAVEKAHWQDRETTDIANALYLGFDSTSRWLSSISPEPLGKIAEQNIEKLRDRHGQEPPAIQDKP